ncbi:hypothetical protein [Arenivirga flava]|uniref:Uncharacterized protein n=1 Tax=Arenivirga flava TaxID=1930060 RepID=A0AA37X9W8_9MICO|nr:hypothetical protein [Arenivirga flava]GMA27163.1 hypothetical protein GCM10025874_04160 [Arenivirga flava]
MSAPRERRMSDGRSARERATLVTMTVAMLVLAAPILIAGVGAIVVGALEHEAGDSAILEPVALAIRLLVPAGIAALVLGVAGYALGARITAVVAAVTGAAYVVGGGILLLGGL